MRVATGWRWTVRTPRAEDRSLDPRRPHHSGDGRQEMSKTRGRGAEIRRLCRKFGLSREEALQVLERSPKRAEGVQALDEVAREVKTLVQARAIAADIKRRTTCYPHEVGMDRVVWDHTHHDPCPRQPFIWCETPQVSTPSIQIAGLSRRRLASLRLVASILSLSK